MAKAAKVFGIVQGTISMFTGAAKALELPFPANIAAMAAVLAKGAGLVASIKGTAVPGFMTGGSFRVGGSGGPDSQLMQFMASPGEMVDIRRPGDAGGGRGNVPTVALTLQGFAFSRDQLRTMIEGFNEMFRDGYKLEIPAA